MRYVVVDDEPKIREGLTGFLKTRQDCEEVKTFASATDALNYLREAEVDVLLTDIKMPSGSGLDLIEHIRSIRPDLAIIIISGYSEFDYAQKAIELGVRRYLTKPTDPAELTDILNNISSEKKDSSLPEDKVVRSVIAFMEENLQQKLELSQLANHAFVTPNYLCRRFRELTEKSPMEYLTDLRIGKAKILLKDLAQSVETVSAQTGYTDRRSFSRAFKRLTGMTPQDYRNQL
jgi:two-component system response regulator YesN